MLRRHVQRGLISEREVRAALAAGAELIEHRYPHVGRLAELVTADSKLTRSPNIACAIELI